jgi:hypothetical protein
LFLFRSDTPKADRHRKGRGVRHREAFAAQRLLLGGRRDHQRTEEGEGDSKGYVKRSQHGMTHPRQRPEGRTVSPKFGNVMMAFAHGSVPELLHRGRTNAVL